jgi:hypothetical protein
MTACALELTRVDRASLEGLPYSKAACLSIAALAKNPAAQNYIKGSGNRGVEMALKWFATNALSF